MTPSLPVQRVVDLLTAAGYRLREAPATVASVPFEFSAMLVGSERALDLIVVIDVLVEPEARIRQKVEGLSRALDLASSRRPLTVVLVGPAPRAAVTEAISRVCRVLLVGTPTGPGADRFLVDALAALLPLDLPAASEAIVAPLDEVRRRLTASSADLLAPSVEAILDASLHDADSVRDVLRAQLQAAVTINLEGDALP